MLLDEALDVHLGLRSVWKERSLRQLRLHDPFYLIPVEPKSVATIRTARRPHLLFPVSHSFHMLKQFL